MQQEFGQNSVVVGSNKWRDRHWSHQNAQTVQCSYVIAHLPAGAMHGHLHSNSHTAYTYAGCCPCNRELPYIFERVCQETLRRYVTLHVAPNLRSVLLEALRHALY